MEARVAAEKASKKTQQQQQQQQQEHQEQRSDHQKGSFSMIRVEINCLQ